MDSFADPSLQPNDVAFGITYDLTTPTGIGEGPPGVTANASLDQNYPNPFNPTTEIRFDLPQEGHVTLEVFNLLGQMVATLIDEKRDAGEHSVSWNAGNVSSGVYFYRLKVGEFVETKKMMLLK